MAPASASKAAKPSSVTVSGKLVMKIVSAPPLPFPARKENTNYSEKKGGMNLCYTTDSAVDLTSDGEEREIVGALMLKNYCSGQAGLSKQANKQT